MRIHGIAVDLNGQAPRGIVAENLLDDHFGPDGLIEIEIVVESHGSIDVVESPAPIRVLLAVLAADAEGPAGIALLIPPHVLAKHVARHRLGQPHRAPPIRTATTTDTTFFVPISKSPPSSTEKTASPGGARL